MIKHLIIVYFRHLIKHKTITFISLFGLAIGIASTLSLVSYSRYELSYDESQPSLRSIYRLNFGYEKDATSTPNIAVTSAALKPIITTKANSIVESVTLLQKPTSSVSLKVNNKKVLGVKVQAAEGNIIDFFPVKELKGDLSKLDSPGFVFISESTALKLYGELPEIGKPIEINFGKEIEILQIGGVFTDMPENSHIDLDVIYSILTLKSKWPNTFESLYRSNMFAQYITFKKGHDVNELAEILVQHYEKTNPNSNSKIMYQLQDIKSIHLNPMHIGEFGKHSESKNVYITLLLALLISLTASFNYSSLVNARASLRSNEYGIKKVVGVQRSAFFTQIIVETAITVLISFVFASILLYMALPIFNDLLGINLYTIINVSDSLWVLFGFTLLVFVNCLAPIIQISKISIYNLLKGNLLYGKKAAKFRSIMIFFQMSFSILVLVLLGILANQIYFLQNRDLGISKENLFISQPLPNASINNSLGVIKDILGRSFNSPIITTTEVAPLESHNMMASKILLDGSESKVIDVAPLIGVNYNFVETLGMKLIEGSDFREEIESDFWSFGAQGSRSTSGVIVNQSFLDSLSVRDPKDIIGKFIIFNWLQYPVKSRIVGVVENPDFLDSQNINEPLLFALGFFYQGEQSIIVKVPIEGEKSKIQEAISQQTLIDEVKVYTFQELISKEYEDANKQLSFLLVFAIILLVILFLGVLGLSLYSADRKKKEIAIRKVIGAKLKHIVWILLKNLLTLIVIASIFVLPLIYILSDYVLNSFDERPPFPIHMVLSSIALILLLCICTVMAVCVNVYHKNANQILKNE